MDFINGGICSPKGFSANGIHCGVRKNKTKKDLALIFCDRPAVTVSAHTRNLVLGAGNIVTKEHLSDGISRAVICNSGNANTCNKDGIEVAREMSRLAAERLDISPSDVVVASTGVIGEPLDITPIKSGMQELVAGLASTPENSLAAAGAIMTTDTVSKQVAVKFNIGEKVCKIGGIAKGSGMIHPDMATLLVFITTDCKISRNMLQKALSTDVDSTFNMVSIDGDTSTNDMVCIMASGAAENAEIEREDEDFAIFMQALNTVTVALCQMIAGDGEGATKMLECVVSGARDFDVAKRVAKTVITSSLLKSAMFGADANWGRVLCAVGYSGADVDVDKIDVSFTSQAGAIAVCKNGRGVAFCEDTAKKILTERNITINVCLNDGNCAKTAWGCDLTYDYVRINGDYRT